MNMNNKRGLCVCNSKWGEGLIAAYAKWVKGGKRKALCTLCDRVIDISCMGESALKSHCKGEKHKSKVSSASCGSSGISITTFFGKSEKNEAASNTLIDLNTLTIPPPPVNVSNASNQIRSVASIGTYLSNDQVLRSEILWTLKLVTSHQSYKSSEESNKLFQAMLDSEIAKRFTCGEGKSAYLSVFGIGEHFIKLLKNAVSESGLYVILFDESLNRKMQEKQMDIHIRFWNDNTNTVDTRYMTSEFLGHATADDMMSQFTQCVLESGLPVNNMVQVSMDGPNVNWKFLDLLKDKMPKDYDAKLINIGSCGLHVMHNSFKSGAEATGWNVSGFLSGLYYLFKDSPARKEDWKNVTGCGTLPLKFVNHRWLENFPVCERAIQQWDKIVEYVEAAESKKVTKPANKSFETVKECVKDACFVAKLHFFKSIALQLQPFLATYQTNKPMLCFLGEDHVNLIRCLMRRFIKSEKLEGLDDNKLVKIDVTDKDCHVTYTKIDVGFSCEKELKKPSSGTLITERQVMEFRMECKEFLIKLLQKLLARSPVSYSLVRNMSCLSPFRLVSDKDGCIQKLKKLLMLLVTAKRVREEDCDVILQQYMHFIDAIPMLGSYRFTHFDKSKNSVCELFHDAMCKSGRKDQYGKLFEPLKLTMILSHGQAEVERGFSVNKEVEVENMKCQTLKAHRSICDHVNSVGCILNVDINKEMLLSAKFSRQRYEKYLEVEREKKMSAEKNLKRKSTLEGIEELKKKKKRMELDIDSPNKTAEELYLKGEAVNKMRFIVQANALRKSVKEKTLQLGQLTEHLEKQVEHCV